MKFIQIIEKYQPKPLKLGLPTIFSFGISGRVVRSAQLLIRHLPNETTLLFFFPMWVLPSSELQD